MKYIRFKTIIKSAPLVFGSSVLVLLASIFAQNWVASILALLLFVTEYQLQRAKLLTHMINSALQTVAAALMEKLANE